MEISAEELARRKGKIRECYAIVTLLDDEFRKARELAAQAESHSIVYRIDKHLKKLKFLQSHLVTKMSNIDARLVTLGLRNGD